jgi:hypothetical protein
MKNHPAERVASSPPAVKLPHNTSSLWERFWFTPADPTTLGLIRICCGLVTLYVHLCYSWGLLSYVGPQAWLSNDVASYIRLKQPFYAPGMNWEESMQEVGQGNFYWSIYFHVTDPRWIVGIHVAILVSMLLFTIGLWTRYTSILAWIGAMSYVQRASTTVFGLDTMMMIVLLYLMIGPSGAALSVDRWLQRRRERRAGLPPSETTPLVSANFSIRLLQVHFCIVYLAAGTSKLLGESWWSGTAPNMVVLNYSFAPFYLPGYSGFMHFLANHRWLWEICMSVGVVYTLIVEIGLPFLIWDRRWRWLMICGSVLLHTAIAVSMGLVTFSLIMLVMVLAFVPPEVVHLVLERVRQRVQRLREAHTRSPAQVTAPGPVALTGA